MKAAQTLVILANTCVFLGFTAIAYMVDGSNPPLETSTIVLLSYIQLLLVIMTLMCHYYACDRLWNWSSISMLLFIVASITTFIFFSAGHVMIAVSGYAISTLLIQVNKNEPAYYIA